MSEHDTADKQSKSGQCETTASPGRPQGPERSDRLGPLEPSHAFAATKYGESSTAKLALPANQGMDDAAVNLVVEGTGFRLDSMWATKLPTGRGTGCGTTYPPRVVYSPPNEGSHRGRLIYTAKWPDGHTERSVVELYGSSMVSADPGPALRTSSAVNRLTHIRPVDLGEQIVGSRHEFPMDGPMNVSGEAGFGAVAVKGTPGLGAAWGTLGQVVNLEPGQSGPPIRVTFAPPKSGRYQGQLELVAHWPDKHVERQTVEVAATAREKTDAPAQDEAVAIAPSPPDRLVREKTMTIGQAADRGTIDGMILNLFDHQSIGVGVVQLEQAGYKAPPASKPLWLDLVELAITLAADAAGQFAISAITSRLAKSLGIGAKVVGAAASVAPPAQLSLFKPDEPTQEQISGTPIAVDPTHAATTVVSKLVGGLKGFVVTAAKASVQAAAAPGELGTTGHSRDPQIDFFTEQKNLLSNARREATSHTLATALALAGLDTTFPDLSATVLQAMASASSEVALRAQDEQMRHTSAQWLAYRSRMSLGAESVTGHGTVTKLQGARDFDKLEAPSSAKGLLDIHVQLKGGKEWVRSAGVTGVSKLVAERILNVNLRSEHIPVRLVINDGAAYVTRDEAGRVRYSGVINLDPDNPVGTATEETQQLRTVQLLTDRVLSKTLGQWGVSSIVTDDIAH